MRIQINAGFGNPIGTSDLSLIGNLEFDGVRQDVITPQDAEALVDELDSCFPIFIAPNLVIAEAVLWAAKHRRPPSSYGIEFGNELNLKVSASFYATQFSLAEAHLRSIEPEVQLVTAGINTTSRKGLAWLEQAVTGASGKAIIGFHSYRPNMTPSPTAPQEGMRSRSAEFADLHRIAQGRRLWNTEIGWHTAPRESGWWIFKRRFKLTDHQVAGYLKEEIALNRAAGVDLLTVYQLNDGPNANYDQDCYGIRRTDGTLKPSAHVAKGVA